MSEPSQNSWIGRRLGGRYEILDVIGEGGMGVIYRAKQISVDRLVAIKMMHARAAQDPKWVERFQAEAKACSLLAHPNTVRLFDFGQTTLGNFYMVMELLEGRSLRQVLHQEGAMEAPRVLRILMQVCASLCEAHEAGIIHRDIKPENIYLLELAGASDFVKLFDFSIAKRSDVAMTAAGMVFGTPQFMSPEQTIGKGIDHRSDLYSLGVVAYALLTNRLPFHDEDPIEVLKMHQTAEVPPLPAEVPDSVAKLVLACLEKEPRRRPANARALLEASKVWLKHLDPSLDVASDPILKNTLISTGPPKDMTIPPSADDSGTSQPKFKPSATQAKTMLSASGASTLRSKSPVPSSGIRNPANSVISTMIHASGGVEASQVDAVTRPVERQPTPAKGLPLSADSSPTRASGHRAVVPSPHPGASPSTGGAAHAASPNGPSPAAIAPQERHSPVGASQPSHHFSHHPSHPGQAPAGPSQGPYAQLDAQAPMNTPMPLGPSSGKAGFLALCVLVAATFGFGGYYLTTMLR